MKKILLYILGLSLVLSSCKEESVEDIFDQLPETRTKEVLDNLKRDLEASEHGWATYFLFNDGNKDSYFNIRFLKDDSEHSGNTNRAEIEYEYNKQVLKQECGYTLRYAQQVELIFDTYSPLALLVGEMDHGDFRFRLENSNQGRFVFKSFNDSQDGEGFLYLDKAREDDNYAHIQAIRRLLQNDGNKSFYRIMKFDDSDQKFVYRYQVDAVVDYLEDGILKTKSSSMEVSYEGARFEVPLVLAGHQIDRLLLNTDDSTFSIMEGDKKVGVLDYTNEKPFVYPGAVKLFMDAIGADTSSIMIAPIAFSQKLGKRYAELLESDSEFFQLVIEPCLHWIAFGNRNNYFKSAYYRINTDYGEDSMCFNWVGTANDEGWSKSYYEKHGHLMLDELVTNQIGGGEKKVYSIIPRGNYFYFVRDDDPTISFVGKPQFKDAL